MAIASMMLTCSTPFRNVFQIGIIPTSPQTPWPKTSMTFLNTMENSNSKKQRGSWNPTIAQDNNKSQPARNQNQCHQGNQNPHNGNNCHNEESFCSYHQLCRHSDAKCCDPCNPKEQMPTMSITMIGIATMTVTTNMITTTKMTKRQSKQPAMQPLLSDTLSAAKGRKHQQQEASNNHSQHITNHSKSDDKIFAPWKKRAALTTMIKTSSPNKTMYQKSSLVYLPTSLQNDTSTFEHWLTQDLAPWLSVNPLCLTQPRRRLKMIL